MREKVVNFIIGFVLGIMAVILFGAAVLGSAYLGQVVFGDGAGEILGVLCLAVVLFGIYGGIHAKDIL